MKKISILILIIWMFSLLGCYTPATFQNAKLIPAKQLEITPTCTFNTPMTNYNTNYGILVKYGLNEKKNLLFRYEAANVSESHPPRNHYFGIGGKISWIKNKLTYTDFAGIYFFKNNIFEDPVILEYQPSVNWTFYDDDHFEFNLSLNIPIYLFASENIGFAGGPYNLNFCPAFSSDFKTYSIRPLLGVSFWGDSVSHRFYQGIAFSYNFQL